MSPIHAITRAILSSALCGVCAVGTAFAATAASALQDALAQCAAIAGRDDRLACFDALASHHPSPPDNGPAPARQSARAPAAAAIAAPTAAAPADGARVVPAVPAESERPEDFGLNAAQRGQTEPHLSSIIARVSGFSHSKQGKIQVELDNGQAWELDEADPLLAPGDPVTIRRATLGSYVLLTPSRRSHRVRRTQ
jgi:hypothetical protein